jgi:hypothetical protein
MSILVVFAEICPPELRGRWTAGQSHRQMEDALEQSMM